MTYITIKRTRINSLSGTINLPYGTEIDCVDGVLLHNGAPICADHSQNAYDFFSRNDDGEGLRRGELTQGIRKALAKNKADSQNRWNKVWEDPVCRKYKRADHADFWLWNHDFYNAEIPDLVYIAKLVGMKGVS